MQHGVPLGPQLGLPPVDTTSPLFWVAVIAIVGAFGIGVALGWALHNR